MSRMTTGLLLIAWPFAASAAEPLTAEQAMENYRILIPPTGNPPCPETKATDEIIVCGRSSERNRDRLPLPIEPLPGDRVRGEPISTVAAAGTREKCSTVGPNQNCGGGLPILGIAMFLAKIVKKKILDPED